MDQLRQEFVRDHKQYIISYIDHKNGEVLNKCRRGMHRVNECNNLMSDISIRYPRLMSYMMNPSEAHRNGIDNKSLVNEMTVQLGGTNFSEMEKKNHTNY